MSNSVQPQRWQPTRLPHPWDSLGKNTGVGCHFLLQCMNVKSEREVAQLCPTLCDPVDCSPPGSPVHGIFPGKNTGVGCHAQTIVCLPVDHHILQSYCLNFGFYLKFVTETCFPSFLMSFSIELKSCPWKLLSGCKWKLSGHVLQAQLKEDCEN